LMREINILTLLPWDEGGPADGCGRQHGHNVRRLTLS
jgi:hypothetical protein